jgi:hypothetical protein
MEATAASATAVAIGQGQQLRTSADRGVGWCKRTGKFYASLRDKTRSQHLGYFATEDEAAQAYDARARQLRGVAARLNFPGEGDSNNLLSGCVGGWMQSPGRFPLRGAPRTHTLWVTTVLDTWTA